MKRRWSHLLACLAILVGTIVVAQAAPARQATPASTTGITLAASGLQSPRGFTWGADGTLYVSQAIILPETDSGTPPATPSATQGGLDGNVVSVSDGCPVVYQGNLPSDGGTGGPNLGPSGLAFIDGQLYVVDEGGGASHGNPLTPNGVYLIPGDGSATVVADIGAWIRANPVANPPDDGEPEGNLTAMVAHDGALLVVESDGGQVLQVTTDGTVSRLADLSSEERVSGIAISQDGSVLAGAGSRVVSIASDGSTSDVWTGLTSVVAIAVSPDGTHYAIEESGTVVRQTGSAESREVATGFDAPVAMRFGPDGGLYVSSPATGSDPSVGSVARLDTSEGAVMTMSDAVLAGSPCISTPAPTPTPTTAGTPDGTPSGTPDGTPAGTGSSVTIDNFAYSPATLTVSAGTTVTWTNNDTVSHTVTADDGSFDSGNLAPGATFTHTFTTAGTVSYHCDYHPNMTASVVVS